MLELNSPQIVQETILRWKQKARIALVPTMGSLHEGHLALVRTAKQHSEKVIVSIFVNPLQFGPREDFEKYPRPLEQDIEKLEALDVDLLFVPTVKDFYPEGFNTSVKVDKLGAHLCGRSRPGHFDGVTTVCLKLFLVTQADIAIFGKKDFQQLRIIEQMVTDLNLPLTIVPHRIVRDSDGLALSSRNRFLTEDQRKDAATIPLALNNAKERFRSESNITVEQIINQVKDHLGPSLTINYIDIATAKELAPLPGDTELSAVSYPRLFISATLGETRLIDNVGLSHG